MTIAQTILRQIGGGRFMTMTGAKALVDTGNGLRMTLPSTITKGRINRLTITLRGDDTYTIETGRFAKLDYRTVETMEGVYVDMIHDVIRDLTGLATRL
ncbi:hypothetical protein [Sphingomonas sp. S6]|jgi:hypothetical protein|uniref:hypothetical protein n=1 Tax=Sphingomonas sp. S6 TaxID=3368600 RepID=UPI000FBFE21C|nr:hypothetical protein [uncultured Sphingomonas sp.]RTL17441.1 MAG: hypothetical protein EKK50_09335 [Sphingomonadaceae bacterium]